MRFDDLVKKKLLVIVLLSIWGGLPYRLIQSVDFTRVFVMPTLKIDHLIPTNFDTVWIYHSWYLLMILSVFLIRDVDVLRRFAWSVFLVNAISFVVFLIWPTLAPRPSDLAEAPWLYLLTIELDKPLNACPSLHASITLIGTTFCVSQMKHLRRNLLCKALVLLWGAAILWSTMATRQHVFLDIVAGSMLGGVIAYFSLRGPRPNRERLAGDEWERAAY